MPWTPPTDNRQNRKRLKLLERDGDRCWLCGEPFSNKSGRKPSLDHVIPKSKGGTTAMDNMRLAHSRCNYKRGDSGIIPGVSRTVHRIKEIPGINPSN